VRAALQQVAVALDHPEEADRPHPEDQRRHAGQQSDLRVQEQRHVGATEHARGQQPPQAPIPKDRGPQRGEEQEQNEAGPHPEGDQPLRFPHPRGGVPEDPSTQRVPQRQDASEHLQRHERRLEDQPGDQDTPGGIEGVQRPHLEQAADH
jgi:hypothetical protein